MAKKDIAEKSLEGLNDVFADIINVLLFAGKEIVKEDELEQGIERETYIGESGLREQERDRSKFWKKNNIRISYFGFENETEPENDMPFRVIGYDGAGYRDQIYTYMDDDGKRHKSMVRYPVITLVLNLNYKHKWNKARSIHEALGDRIPDELKRYVKDYKLNIFDIAFLSKNEVMMFKSDFGIVADYLYQMRTNGDYVPTDRTIVHVREVLNFMSSVTDDNRFKETTDELLKGDEPKNMCTVLDKIEKKGREEGEGKLIIKLIQKKLQKGKTSDQIADELEETIELIDSIISAINSLPPESRTDDNIFKLWKSGNLNNDSQTQN